MTWACQRDGACCTEPAAVVMTHAERTVLEQAAPVGSVMVFEGHADPRFVSLIAHPCPLYSTTNGCTVYDSRPYNCRRFACLREDYTEPYDAHYPEPTLRADRRQLLLIQRRAQPWARSHGWGMDE